MLAAPVAIATMPLRRRRLLRFQERGSDFAAICSLPATPVFAATMPRAILMRRRRRADIFARHIFALLMPYANMPEFCDFMLDAEMR